MALTVDKDLAKRVVEEIDRMALNDPSSQYTFINFCESKHLFHENDKVLKSGSLFICCPFHHDESPSLGINEERRIWNCLGCAKHGKFIDFVRYYNSEVAGNELSYYQQVNELLGADVKLQRSVGATTIYKQVKVQESFNGVSYRKFRLKSQKPKTYPELASFLQKKKYSTEMIIFALLQMQAGIPPELIYDNLMHSSEQKNTDTDSGAPIYDVGAILSDDSDLTQTKGEDKV